MPDGLLILGYLEKIQALTVFVSPRENFKIDAPLPKQTP